MKLGEVRSLYRGNLALNSGLSNFGNVARQVRCVHRNGMVMKKA
jgi:hypothetical protein